MLPAASMAGLNRISPATSTDAPPQLALMPCTLNRFKPGESASFQVSSSDRNSSSQPPLKFMIAFALKLPGSRGIFPDLSKSSRNASRKASSSSEMPILNSSSPPSDLSRYRDEMPTAPVLKPKISPYLNSNSEYVALNSVSCGEFLLMPMSLFFRRVLYGVAPGVKGRTVCSKLSKLNWIDSGANSSPSDLDSGSAPDIAIFERRFLTSVVLENRASSKLIAKFSA